MFNKQVAVTLLLWIALVAVCGLFFYRSTPEAALRYQAIIHGIEGKESEPQMAQQARKNITKQILYTQGGKRLQSNLAGVSSDLAFSKKSGEFTESIQGVNCSLEGQAALMIDSGEVKYKEKEIVLSGNVAVQHDIGSVSAREMIFRPSSSEERTQDFGELSIRGDVTIALSEGGMISCQEALIDYDKMEGTFLGCKEHPKVVYSIAKQPYNCEVKSDSLAMRLAPSSGPLGNKSIDTITATGSVTLTYNDVYTLLADRAVYNKATLTLTAGEGSPRCQLKGGMFEGVTSEQIDLYPEERKLTMISPKGRLNEGDGKILSFSADEIAWDDASHTLLLRGKVNLRQEEALHLFTDGQLVAHVTDSRIERAEVLGGSQLTYRMGEQVQSYTVHCPGPMTMDLSEQEIVLHGSGEQQVYIDESFGEIYADRVRISTATNEGQPTFEKLLFEGNVSLKNRYDKAIGESTFVLHYALADRVECIPAKRHIDLSCERGKRVLLYDKANGVRMSAPRLHIQPDETTAKPQVTGSGDVRFSFVAAEIDQFKKHFQLFDTEKDK